MKQLKFLLLLSIVATFSSCALFKKAMAPKFDSYAASQSQAISLQQFGMYNRMLTSNDKSAATWASSEDSIINELQTLVTYDAGRKNNTAILKLTGDWLNRSKSFLQEHASYNILNKGQIQAYQNSAYNLGNIVFKTETNYKP